MRRLVLDNSVAAAWCFRDERTAYSVAALEDVVEQGGVVVPCLWPVEMANVLVVAERKGRIDAEQRAGFLETLFGLDIAVQQQTAERTLGAVIDLAHRHSLSAYDATYLELALREGLPIVSLDRRLIRAARAAGVGLHLAHLLPVS